MPSRPSGLGRGLGSLIPQKAERPAFVASAVAPSPAAAVPGKPENKVLYVPVAEIIVNPEQPRATFRHQELEDLTNSIREHGIIQPLVVSQRQGGGYELIAGERRLRAAKLLNLPTVPAIVRSVNSRDKLLLALIENIQREDLDQMEEAKAYDRLIKQFNLTQEGVAQKVGKARSTVANTLRLLELPAEIQQAIAERAISAGSARAILGLKDDKARLAYFHKLVGKKASTRQVEAGVRKLGGKKRKDPAIAAAEETIRNKLGTKVEIKKRGSQGSVVISFYSAEEYTSLMRHLQR